MSDAEAKPAHYLFCAVRTDGDGGRGAADAAADGDSDGNAGGGDANGDSNGDGGAAAAATVETDATGADAAVADAAPEFSPDGIDGESVSVLTAGDVGVVVQPCDGVYDSSDETTVRRWLLDHQSVVDAAGERFGTPLPFRFDTVIRGDDDAVVAWLRDREDDLAARLEDLAGTWEYRVDVRWDEERVRRAVEATADLADLRERRDDADEGTAYLLEQQYERAVADGVRERRDDLVADLRERVEPHAVAVEETKVANARGESGAGGERSGGGESSGDDRERDDPLEPVVTLALRASEAAADAVGDELDAVADPPGVEVRYTGPWPPYTFATLDA